MFSCGQQILKIFYTSLNSCWLKCAILPPPLLTTRQISQSRELVIGYNSINFQLALYMYIQYMRTCNNYKPINCISGHTVTGKVTRRRKVASHPPFTRKRRDNRIAYIDLSSKQCNAMPMAVVQHMHDHHIMIIFVDIHSLNLLLCHAHHCNRLHIYILLMFSAMQGKVTLRNVYVYILQLFHLL